MFKIFYRAIQTSPSQQPAVNYDCSKQKDGHYGIDKNCGSRDYVICSNGVGYKYSCPSGLIFDQIQVICTYDYNCQT